MNISSGSAFGSSNDGSTMTGAGLACTGGVVGRTGLMLALWVGVNVRGPVDNWGDFGCMIFAGCLMAYAGASAPVLGRVIF